ncbi:hypothetical protein CYMTET_52491, partial [Cymbomonas tetramitiformis]
AEYSWWSGAECTTSSSRTWQMPRLRDGFSDLAPSHSRAFASSAMMDIDASASQSEDRAVHPATTNGALLQEDGDARLPDGPADATPTTASEERGSEERSDPEEGLEDTTLEIKETDPVIISEEMSGFAEMEVTADMSLGAGMVRVDPGLAQQALQGMGPVVVDIESEDGLPLRVTVEPGAARGVSAAEVRIGRKWMDSVAEARRRRLGAWGGRLEEQAEGRGAERRRRHWQKWRAEWGGLWLKNLDLQEGAVAVGSSVKCSPDVGLPAEVDAGLTAEVDAGLPAEVDAGLPAEVAAGLPAEVAAGLPAEVKGGELSVHEVNARADVQGRAQNAQLAEGHRSVESTVGNSWEVPVQLRVEEGSAAAGARDGALSLEEGAAMEGWQGAQPTSERPPNEGRKGVPTQGGGGSPTQADEDGPPQEGEGSATPHEVLDVAEEMSAEDAAADVAEEMSGENAAVDVAEEVSGEDAAADVAEEVHMEERAGKNADVDMKEEASGVKGAVDVAEGVDDVDTGAHTVRRDGGGDAALDVMEEAQGEDGSADVAGCGGAADVAAAKIDNGRAADASEDEDGMEAMLAERPAWPPEPNGATDFVGKEEGKGRLLKEEEKNGEGGGAACRGGPGVEEKNGEGGGAACRGGPGVEERSDLQSSNETVDPKTTPHIQSLTDEEVASEPYVKAGGKQGEREAYWRLAEEERELQAQAMSAPEYKCLLEQWLLDMAATSKDFSAAAKKGTSFFAKSTITVGPIREPPGRGGAASVELWAKDTTNLLGLVYSPNRVKRLYDSTYRIKLVELDFFSWSFIPIYELYTLERRGQLRFRGGHVWLDPENIPLALQNVELTMKMDGILDVVRNPDTGEVTLRAYANLAVVAALPSWIQNIPGVQKAGDSILEAILAAIRLAAKYKIEPAYLEWAQEQQRTVK